jgi:hypothetical protein
VDIYFLGMIGAAALAVSLLGLTSAFTQTNEIEQIQNYVNSYQSNNFLEGSSPLCSTYSCCNISSTDSCPLTKFTKDKSVLVLPGLSPYTPSSLFLIYFKNGPRW